jgi:RHS repeat-associated protein
MDLAPRLRHPTYPRRPRPAGCDHESAEQPAAISGATPASFQYDAFGRRVQKTLGNTATALLYDGPNAVQERVGSSVTNLLAGLGIDEQHTRTDGTDTRALLADALGSTVALVDGSGTVQPEYTYEPFGATTGASGPNPYQFTGREHDGTGLYYYRARYYHPALQRFVSEDPLEFGGGDPNLYTYAFNSPTDYVDPTGEAVPAIVGVLVGFCVRGAIQGGIGAAAGAVVLGGRKPTPGDVAVGAAGRCLTGGFGGRAKPAAKPAAAPCPNNSTAGNCFQNAVHSGLGVPKNTTFKVPCGECGKKHVPDINDPPWGITEIKSSTANPPYLTSSCQLSTFIDCAKRTGQPFNLIVSPGIGISTPLQEAVRDAKGCIYQFNPSTGKLGKWH